MVREKMRTMRAHVAKMSELFHEADTSGARSLKDLRSPEPSSFRGSLYIPFFGGLLLPRGPREPGALRTGTIRGCGSLSKGSSYQGSTLRTRGYGSFLGFLCPIGPLVLTILPGFHIGALRIRIGFCGRTYCKDSPGHPNRNSCCITTVRGSWCGAEGLGFRGSQRGNFCIFWVV